MEEPFRRHKEYGTITLEPSGEFVAGTYTSFILTYKAGVYGMDDLGGLKILFRYACDQSPLQMNDPKGVGYTTATASNGANIELSYALREAKRPWYKMLRIRIAGAGLKEGETITIKLGDKSQGSPGMRLQTFVEPRFEFRTLVDVFSTNVFKMIPSPEISLISGEPVRWRAFLPTLRHHGNWFSLKIRAEDIWGNPSEKVEGEYQLESNISLERLPSSFKWPKGSSVYITDKLRQQILPKKREVVRITLKNMDGEILALSNPLVLAYQEYPLHYWGDIHGQSEETIGTNTARMYFEFARDKAFLDVTGHQGNDFQITGKLWKLFNDLSEEFNKEQFITLCGYEYSANTALGGDRNVYFQHPYLQIHRSSHELISDDDSDTDSLTATRLFEDLIRDNPDYDMNVLTIAHAGGRYSDLLNHHNGRIETAIEIHSAWGTFEWLLHDAFKKGYRMGIVANGDDHKGRPGCAYPGASKFGALGGFTCFKVVGFSRENIFWCLKNRQTYATTGERIFLNVKGELNEICYFYDMDPSLYTGSENRYNDTTSVEMGNIIQVPSDKDVELTLIVEIESASPIERIEIFNGLDLVDIIKPYLEDGNEKYEKIRVIWEGAEFRARRRNANWNGTVQFVHNEIKSFYSFNFWNIDYPLKKVSPNQVAWNTMTSGNFQGFDVILKDEREGNLVFKSNQINFEVPISEITIKDTIFEAGGLGKRVRIFRLPAINPYTSLKLERSYSLAPTIEKDDRFYVKITLENGHQAWSSPMYFIRNSQ